LLKRTALFEVANVSYVPVVTELPGLLRAVVVTYFSHFTSFCFCFDVFYDLQQLTSISTKVFFDEIELKIEC